LELIKLGVVPGVSLADLILKKKGAEDVPFLFKKKLAWYSSGNAAAFGAIKDPNNNVAIGQ